MSIAPGSTAVLDHRFATELPELAVRWQAESTPDPRLLVLNESLAADLRLDPGWLRSSDGIGLLVGTRVPADAQPVAQGYAGHQFGGWVPRLGDGRALLLGELIDARDQLRDLHLKGSGRTPFARGGDGLAAVGPMLREYLISEAMAALGIPTTRALSVVATGRPAQRETLLDGAVLARVAASHLRVGSFQYVAAAGDLALLRRLADHAISRHYPAAVHAENPYLALLDSVVAAQADLIAQWMLVGFIHGVMNTDNMTISGETIDYGPCAFMDAFDPKTVFSSIDSWGRYAYGNQPAVAGWNLARFAEALLPLIADDQEQALALATTSVQEFPQLYTAAWSAGMRRKLGLGDAVDDGVAQQLVDELSELLGSERIDYTSFFRRLAGDEVEPPFEAWATRWRRLDPDLEAMQGVNPVYIPRNHLVEEALAAAASGDMEPFDRLLAVISSPYDEREGCERYAEPAPDEFGRCFQTFCGT
ncbi:YdiU family protein [Mycobacterium sp. CVI_P3]|uniref:Protein nucleotidyltransferase YdiU n=1 Tax=Mycobacterium pinniadriaticum TaxID=2994102 RepID=A0ABT3SC41_9MYCO|nr:YdiU family protein [Mycobacterium pinniadriaticum]MCX2930518.1 YdiU family protein [Mycobacterium pinniadriaticum]MCX2936942.1 YdiU family protein [Mycobacterium pinniadriaticum]